MFWAEDITKSWTSAQYVRLMKNDSNQGELFTGMPLHRKVLDFIVQCSIFSFFLFYLSKLQRDGLSWPVICLSNPVNALMALGVVNYDCKRRSLAYTRQRELTHFN